MFFWKRKSVEAEKLVKFLNNHQGTRKTGKDTTPNLVSIISPTYQ